MKRKVAIFDIDGTIFRSSLLIEVMDTLIHDGVFPKSTRKEYARELHNWVERKDGYEKYIMAVVHSFMKHIKGVKHADFVRAAGEVLADQRNKVYRYTRDLIKYLKKHGYYLLAVSQSPMELVQGFGKKMGFDMMYGRIYEVGTNGKFTGKILRLDLIADKSNVIRRVVERQNLTLKGSYGVGDTEGDINLLKMVENPICFNPNENLYRHAKNRKWKIVVERKDMIYTL